MAFNAALRNGSSPLVRSSPIADDEQCINPSVHPGCPNIRIVETKTLMRVSSLLRNFLLKNSNG